MKSDTLLLGAIGAAPVVWFLNLETSFLLAPQACNGAGKLPVYLVTLLTFGLTFAAAIYSLTQFQSPDLQPANSPDAVKSRRRGLALAAFGLSAFSCLVLIVQAIPNLILAGCE